VSDPTDDTAFEEYLKRGSVVSQQYRSLQEVEPPSHLDKSVLAQAERATQSQTMRKSRLWKTWSVPIALAASTLIAVSIVLESGMQHEITSSAPFPAQKAEVDAPETADANAARAPDETAEAERSADLNATIVHVETTVSAPAPAMEAPADAPDPVLAAKAERAASAPMPVEEERRAQEQIVALEQANAEAEGSEPVAQYSVTRPAPQIIQPAAKRSERRAAASSAAVADQPRQLARDPEEWLRDIRELRTAGETQEADRQWKEFEIAFPDYNVAEDDSARPAE
jgi:hypothetical protein